MENPKETKPLERFWITRDEWENHPERCAVKFGVVTVVALAASQFAPWIAIGAGLVVVVGKLVRL